MTLLKLTLSYAVAVTGVWEGAPLHQPWHVPFPCHRDRLSAWAQMRGPERLLHCWQDCTPPKPSYKGTSRREKAGEEQGRKSLDLSLCNKVASCQDLISRLSPRRGIKSQGFLAPRQGRRGGVCVPAHLHPLHLSLSRVRFLPVRSPQYRPVCLRAEQNWCSLQWDREAEGLQ